MATGLPARRLPPVVIVNSSEALVPTVRVTREGDTTIETGVEPAAVAGVAVPTRPAPARATARRAWRSLGWLTGMREQIPSHTPARSAVGFGLEGARPDRASGFTPRLA